MDEYQATTDHQQNLLLLSDKASVSLPVEVESGLEPQIGFLSNSEHCSESERQDGDSLENLLESLADPVLGSEAVSDAVQSVPVFTSADFEQSDINGEAFMHDATNSTDTFHNDQQRVILLGDVVSTATTPSTVGQSIMLSSSETVTNSNSLSFTMPSKQAATEHQQQIVIPIETLAESMQVQSGNTILLPVIPTLMPDGRIEMRLATNNLSIQQQQQLNFAGQTAGLVFGSSSDMGEATTGGDSIMLQQIKPSQDQSDAPPTVVFINPADHTDGRVDEQSKLAEGDGTEEGSMISSLVDQARLDVKKQQTAKVFKCEFCDYSNHRRYLLIRHLKSHSEDRPYRCTICERRFKTTSSLQNHTNTHTGVKPFQCTLCESAFTTSGEMVRHARYKHTMEKPHKCPDPHCDYATVELSKLKRHYRSHTGERPFKCQHCEYSSPDTYKLKRHIRIHTGEKPYECSICFARFSQSNSLKSHNLIHRPEGKPIFRCTYCSTTCGRKTDLRLHILKLHNSLHPLPCQKCGKKFADKYSLKKHNKTHEGQKCFVCPHCPYAASVHRHLEQHILIHSNQKPFICKENGCGLRFRQSSQLRRHQNARHDPYYQPRRREKLLNCLYCDKRFGHKGNFDRHILLHVKANHKSGQFHSEPTDPPEFLPKREEGNTVASVPPAAVELLRPKPTADPATIDEVVNSVVHGNFGSPLSAKLKKRPRQVKRLKLEELGLTNFKTRGRPRNPTVTEAELHEDLDVVGIGDSPIDMERSIEIEKEVEEAFGFSSLRNESTTEDPKSDSYENADVVHNDVGDLTLVGDDVCTRFRLDNMTPDNGVGMLNFD